MQPLTATAELPAAPTILDSLSHPDATADSDILTLGIEGFSFEDLYRPAGLQRLAERFDAEVRIADPVLFADFERYRKGEELLAPPAESELLIRVAEHQARFLVRLFGIEAAVAQLGQGLISELDLFEAKREFITRRVFKRGAPDRPTAAEFPALDAQARLLLQLGFPAPAAAADPERQFAEALLTLLSFERLFLPKRTGEEIPEAEAARLAARWSELRRALLSTPAGSAAFASALAPAGTDAEDLQAVRALLALLDRWTFARALHPEGRRQIAHWSTIRQPQPLDFEHLVELERPDPALEEAAVGPEETLRRRDGFKLTDGRMGPREVMGEIDYCVFCHEREKDSCSSGIPAKDPVAEGNTYKKNPLDIPLTGCPIDERISEAHVLKSRGNSLGALAMVMLDNPMCPGTGHRICNDCMKSCIFQKQEPVNIPQIETSILTDVLNLPYGFELYGLLTRWNPLNVKRPYALPYLGKNVLVVGMGPAGYTLAHYLLNEGFAVVGIDGLKIEPLDDALTGRGGRPLQPVREFATVCSALDERILAGFGGVSEYGITVRWDKNFLTLLYLTLVRRESFAVYGGVRFGGTLTLDDAWDLGFDHVAVAAGAGRPTIINMKNNLIRGIRKASDFLMALQLTGAGKRDSLANLQLRLPAIVIGGGLTAIDTATEAFAYYPVQVEKLLDRHERLAMVGREAALMNRLDPEEKGIYSEFLDHGRAVRAERARAATAGEAPDFVPLVRGWGGVSICYRRSLDEAPAYRLNHEEVAKAFEEGIRFVERMSPTEAVPDANGAVMALKLERMAHIDGRLKGTGEILEMPARSVLVAAGTAPNVNYEREQPGSFDLDEQGWFFKGHQLVEEDGRQALLPVAGHKDLGKPAGFFTSYDQDGKRVTFYGDNHPTYAGNVVKAMASAKDGYPEVVRLFARELAGADRGAAAQRARDAARAAFFDRLDDRLVARVVQVNRLTPTIVEVVVRAPAAVERFHPGQFYRLQNFESRARLVEGTRLQFEGLALTGAWVDKAEGLLSTIVLEMGSSSRLVAALQPGEEVVLMGPTGTPTEIPAGETVLLAGGGLGNAVLFSIGQALREAGCKVLYFAAYKQIGDCYKMDEIEEAADQIIWSVDIGDMIRPRRPQDASFLGNVVQAMLAYGEGRIEVQRTVELREVDRIIAIGSDRMMRAVKEARHAVLAPHLKAGHTAIGSINSPMQCMMKEICAQCLQKHVDPVTGQETVVFSCFNQDQPLDQVDFGNLNARLRNNSVLEKASNAWLDHLLARIPDFERV